MKSSNEIYTNIPPQKKFLCHRHCVSGFYYDRHFEDRECPSGAIVSVAQELIDLRPAAIMNNVRFAKTDL